MGHSLGLKKYLKYISIFIIIHLLYFIVFSNTDLKELCASEKITHSTSLTHSFLLNVTLFSYVFLFIKTSIKYVDSLHSLPPKHISCFQEIAELLKDLKGDVIASVPMTDFIKGYQTHKYMLPK